MGNQKQAIFDTSRRAQGPGAHGRGGVGQCGSGTIELLPVEEERGSQKGRAAK